MNLVQLLLAAEDETQSPSAIWPEGYELLFGIPAALIVFGLLFWKAGPIVKKALADRTARIQGELDASEAARAAADAEAAGIRAAKGDIEAERARLLAEADRQAEATLAEGRARLQAELAELDTKADADIVAAQGRSGDELRAEIARLSSAAVDHVVTGSLDEATQQALIEDFIARVGASRVGASS